MNLIKYQDNARWRAFARSQDSRSAGIDRHQKHFPWAMRARGYIEAALFTGCTRCENRSWPCLASNAEQPPVLMPHLLKIPSAGGTLFRASLICLQRCNNTFLEPPSHPWRADTAGRAHCKCREFPILVTSSTRAWSTILTFIFAAHFNAIQFFSSAEDL